MFNFFCLLSAFFLIIAGTSSADTEQFFSYKRFFLNRSVIDEMSDSGKIERDLNSFADIFTAGLNEFAAGQLVNAEKKLRNARSIWPEYYGTDFLLAIIYENYGNYDISARYYKTYLNKLSALTSGKYPTSRVLIQSFFLSEIEEYEYAYNTVKKRLRDYDIDLDRVYPVFTVPRFFLFVLWGGASAGIYVIVGYRIYPYLRRQHRIKNPPEGFWICKFCNTANPDLGNECTHCRRPRGL